MENRRTQHAARHRRGFTVIELMTVVAIIIGLVGIMIPVVNKALRDAKKDAIVSVLNSIKTGMTKYKEDMNDFPPSDYEKLGKDVRKNMRDWEGGEILCQMMLGHLSDADGAPLDGKKGLGFKENFTRGNVYGPYVDIRAEENIAKSPITTGSHEFAKVFSSVGSGVQMPILYYRGRSSSASKSGPFDKSTSILGTQGRYNTEDNERLSDPPNGSKNKVLEYLKLSEADDGPREAERDSLRAAMNTAQYLMISAGVDDIFGTKDDVFETGP